MCQEIDIRHAASFAESLLMLNMSVSRGQGHIKTAGPPSFIICIAVPCQACHRNEGYTVYCSIIFELISAHTSLPSPSMKLKQTMHVNSVCVCVSLAAGTGIGCITMVET